MGSFEPCGFCFFGVSGSLGWPQIHYVAREHRIILNSWSPCLHPHYGKDCRPEPLLHHHHEFIDFCGAEEQTQGWAF